MHETILLSIPVDKLQTLIIDCVNVCLRERSQANNKGDIDEILSIKQAAELIKLSVPTIYGLVHREAIPVNKKGKRLYFSRNELIGWIKTGRKKTHDERLLENDICLSRPKKRR